MTLHQNRSTVWLAFTALFFLLANPAISSETASEEDNPDSEGGLTPYHITGPGSRNPFPPEIIDRMRKELMVFMGVEPEKIQEPAETKKAGH